MSVEPVYMWLKIKGIKKQICVTGVTTVAIIAIIGVHYFHM